MSKETIITLSINLSLLEEFDDYLEDKQRLEEVSKGGRYYAECSFMDISSRSGHLDASKKKLIKKLGKIVFKEMENK